MGEGADEPQRARERAALDAEREDAAQPIAPAVPDIDRGAAPAAGPPPVGRSGRHAMRAAAAIFLSRAAGFLRESITGYYFGLGVWADVYSIAMRMPNLLQNLLGDQALSASFIPFYSRMLAEKREDKARRFAGAVLGLLIIAAGALAVAGVVFAERLVKLTAPGFRNDAALVAVGALPADRFALTVQQVRVLFPMAGLLVLSAWALAVLNSHRRFFLPYFAPVLWNVAIIAALLVAGSTLGGPQMTVEAKNKLLYAAAWGALAGGFLQLAVQLPTVFRLLHGLQVSISTRVEGVREALAAFGPVVAGRGAMQLSGYLDFVLASLAAAGASGALRFGMTLFLLPVSIFATSVAVTELPEMSRLSGDEARLRRLEVAWRQISFLGLPAAVGFLAFGWLVVGVVFQHGNFGLADQLLVTLVLAGFTVGLLPATTSRLLQNLFYSFHETRYPARLAVLRMVVSVGGGGLLMYWLDRFIVNAWLPAGRGGHELHLGAVGLALGASAGAWVELALLARGARRRLPALVLPWGAVGRMTALALGAAALAGGLWWLAAGSNRWLVSALVLGGFVVAYLGGAALLRFPEMRAWLGRLRQSSN
ncbi:MAG TPA: murein biosynthesis integral membrane protein MurJ [Thermoanaerobaculia bacterium]|nr:murein biosynthesis integral membrane protein MurJ [Thermoanaerobaculia bacterium]